MFSSQPSWIVWIREELPVPGQHLLPDVLPHDLRVDAEQLGDGGVRVVEAVQQNLRHLSLLLPYQPERIREISIAKFGFKKCLTEIFSFYVPCLLLSSLLCLASSTTLRASGESLRCLIKIL